MSYHRPQKHRQKTKYLSTPVIVFLVIISTMGVTALSVVLLGPPSQPKTQAIGAVEVSIVGLNTNPRYGDLFEFDSWTVVVITNTYNTALDMRPLIKITGLNDCTKVTLQASLDGISFTTIAVVSAGSVCEADSTITYQRNVLTGAIGAEWFFRHRFAADFNQFGDIITFTAQLVQ